MITHATLWGLFGASCGLLVTIAVLVRVLTRGRGATLFILFLGGLASIGALLLLGPRPPGEAWRTGGARYSRVASEPANAEATMVLGDGSELQTYGDSAIGNTRSRSFDPWRLKHQVEGFVERSHKSLTHRHAEGIVGHLVSALAIAAFLYIAYLFLDASTRGHFSWSLRVVSIILFGVIYVAVAVIR